MARTSGWPWAGSLCHQLSPSRLPSDSAPSASYQPPHLWVPTHPPHFLLSRDSPAKSSSQDWTYGNPFLEKASIFRSFKTRAGEVEHDPTEKPGLGLRSSPRFTLRLSTYSR